MLILCDLGKKTVKIARAILTVNQTPTFDLFIFIAFAIGEIEVTFQRHKRYVCGDFLQSIWSVFM
jgi:hypothetical protein